MKALIDELKEYFTNTSSNYRIELENIDRRYPGWAVSYNGGYGVAIEVENGLEIAESFSNVKFRCESFETDNGIVNLLMLTCEDKYFRDKFLALCEDFLNPGVNGILREKLLADPFAWWQEWSELLGNKTVNKEVYDVIAEMQAYLNLKKYVKAVEWTAMHKGSHDIESPDILFEVKSTVVKSKDEITASSAFQFNGDKPFYLLFYRMEKSPAGVSLDDMVLSLTKTGDSIYSIEAYLSELGLERGSHIRKEKYEVIESRIYTVDEEFPAITPASFADGKMPSRIKNITYTIILDGLEFLSWEQFYEVIK